MVVKGGDRLNRAPYITNRTASLNIAGSERVASWLFTKRNTDEFGSTENTII